MRIYEKVFKDVKGYSSEKGKRSTKAVQELKTETIKSVLGEIKNIFFTEISFMDYYTASSVNIDVVIRKYIENGLERISIKYGLTEFFIEDINDLVEEVKSEIDKILTYED